MASNDSEDEYIELKDRINQDVMHDNFVPKYSALAQAEPKPVIIIGVWLIFAPMFLSSIGFWILHLWETDNAVSILIATPVSALFAGLAATILWQQTRRFIRRRRASDEQPPT